MASNRYLASGINWVIAFGLMVTVTVHAAGIAFVTNIKGEAMVAGGKLVLMAEVNRGQRISCAVECTVGIMYLQSGKEFVVKGPGEYLVGENELTAKIGVPPSVRETQWRVSSQTVAQAAQTSSASVRMRGVGTLRAEPGQAAERLLYPLQTSVLNLQPVFRWVSGSAGPFEFELAAADSGKSLYKGKVAATAFELPASIKLSPNTEYRWSVSGAVAGSARFRTMSAYSQELAQSRKPAADAQFSDWLLYALTLQELGARQDAQEHWTRLAAARPDLPELAELAK